MKKGNIIKTWKYLKIWLKEIVINVKNAFVCLPKNPR